MKEGNNELPNNEQTPELPDDNKKPLENTWKEEILTSRDSRYSLDPDNFKNIRQNQNFIYAVVGGLLVALICAFLWAGITVAIKYQIGYMAIAVGLAVGFSVRYFGAGISQKFGILGALLALLSCMLGNLFSEIAFIAREYHYGYFETFSYLDFNTIISIMKDSFSPMDLFFYGIAIFEGYKFSFRNITSEDIEDNGNSPSLKYRLPLVIVGVIILSLIYVKVMMGVNGEKTYEYPSGKIMSKGNLKSSKENGEWTFFNEDGSLQSIGSFKMGIRDGAWKWYSETGEVASTGFYINGIEDGSWIVYFSNGVASDSTNYKNGRMEGDCIKRYENGQIFTKGKYHLSRQEGVWETYYENGQLFTKGSMKDDKRIGDWTSYFEDGKVMEELSYDSEQNLSIKNAWNKAGKQLVTNGNGQYETYFDNGIVASSGEIINEQKSGIWKFFFENGKLKEETIVENNVEKFVNAWEENGNQMIKDGQGTYIIRFPESEAIAQTGNIKDGRKDGTWVMFYQEPKETVLQQAEYASGKVNGSIKSYFQSGQVEAEGTMINDLQEGEWKWFHENGKLSSSVNFKNGKKEGKQVIYNENGEKAIEEYYKNGELIESK